MQKVFSPTNLDILFQRIKEYRTSSYYWDLLQVCKRFRHLAPYNAMLVNMQKPGSRYVLSEQEWLKRYNRTIKPNAQPLVVLVPFGPVDFLFEISDTQPNKTRGLFDLSNEQILEEIEAPYRTKKDVSPETEKMLLDNCALHGVAIDDKMNAGASYAAKIELMSTEAKPLTIHINSKLQTDYTPPYLISINKNAAPGERFANTVHELGHLFCFHLSAPTRWKDWKTRRLSHDVEEFEAESVAWLICERLGIGNPSEKYLANYLDKNDQIPPHVSVERIFSAFNNVWAMINPEQKMTCRDGLIYKNDSDFKQKVKQLTAKK